MANHILLVLLFLQLYSHTIIVVSATKSPATSTIDNQPETFQNPSEDKNIIFLPKSTDSSDMSDGRQKRNTGRNEKGFIRFGRTSENLDHGFDRVAKAQKGYIRFGRSGGDRSNNGFIRFGRSNGREGFVRFGRNNNDMDGLRFGRRGDKFIRFGRSPSKRNPTEDSELLENGAAKELTDDYTKENAYLVRFVKPINRFGRMDKFIRFGRGDKGFIRFGKRSSLKILENGNDDDDDEPRDITKSQNVQDGDNVLDQLPIDFYLDQILDRNVDDGRISDLFDISDGKMIEDNST